MLLKALDPSTVPLGLPALTVWIWTLPVTAPEVAAIINETRSSWPDAPGVKVCAIPFRKAF